MRKDFISDKTDFYTNHICDSLWYETICRVQHPQFNDLSAMKMAYFITSSDCKSRTKRLSFYRCPQLGAHGIGTILDALHERRLQHLSQLEISSVHIADEGLRAVATKLFPEKEEEETMSTIIGTLELEDIGIIQQQTWDFFLPRALNNTSKFHHLETLDLTHNNLTLQSVRILANSLTKNKNLKNLILSENPLIADEGAILIADSLRKNSTLKVLSLAVCKITNAGIHALAECMPNNFSLQRLYLFGNPYDHNSADKVRLTHWVDLNAYGRSTMIHELDNDHAKSSSSSRSLLPSLIPHILTKLEKQDRFDIIYGLLQESLHLWIISGWAAN